MTSRRTPQVGRRTHQGGDRTRQVMEQLGQFPTATLLEAMGGKGCVDPAIRPIASRMRVWGPAVPVYAAPGDNLMVHVAVAKAQPGDVVVACTGGFRDAGIFGEILAVACQARKLGGFVTDGSVRDTGELEKLGLPVFAAGVCINGTSKTCRSKLGEPQTLGGVRVRPGDLVVGDRDGLVVISAERVDEVLEKAREREAKEARIIEQLRTGNATTLELLGLDGE